MPSARVACIQFDTKHADREQNIQTVKRLVSRLVQPVDLVVLSELAISGYVFSDHHQIEPLLETIPPVNTVIDESHGATLGLVGEIARSLSCYVIAGLAQASLSDGANCGAANCDGTTIDAPNCGLVNDTNNSNCLPTLPFSARPPHSPLYHPPNKIGHAYNSAILVDSAGKHLHTFRKHFLYKDDKRWASEGPGFETIELPKLGKVCVAICMDLNPYEFEADFGSFEFANYCAKQNIDMLVVPMAWLISEEQQSASEDMTDTPSMTTINYWALRCSPLFGYDFQASSFDKVQSRIKCAQKTVTFIAANRTGVEGSSTFAGSSCVLEMKYGQPPQLLGALGTKQEDVLVVDLS